MDAPAAEEGRGEVGTHHGQEKEKWGVCPHRLLESRQWDAPAMGGDGGGERASWPEEGRLGRLSMARRGVPGSRGTQRGGAP